MDGTNRLELCKTYVRLLLLTILRNQNSLKSEVDSDTLAFTITIARGVFRIHFSFSNILIKVIRLSHWCALGQISWRFYMIRELARVMSFSHFRNFIVIQHSYVTIYNVRTRRLYSG